ncbi:MAG: hypothetical protein H0U49_03735 [Parachlamydiaceae bacterium]|nr:hypothetical protein [Parachlamydiaceae bacterium]
MDVSNYKPQDFQRVSFSDDKKMVIEGKDKERIELTFKELRLVKEGDHDKEPKPHGNHTRINVINEKDNKVYRVTVKTKDFAEKIGPLQNAMSKSEESSKKLSSKKEKKIASDAQVNMKIGPNKKEKMEINDSPKVKDEPSHSVKSKDVEKTKKVSSKKSKQIESDYQKVTDQESFFNSHIQAMREKARPEDLVMFDKIQAQIEAMVVEMEKESDRPAKS